MSEGSQRLIEIYKERLDQIDVVIFSQDLNNLFENRERESNGM